ncbi:MAG: ROK family protein [Neisseriaceae bacterium]|jgi:glucosamine kinase
MSGFKIGIDGGGTKTHAILVDEENNIIDECFYGPANIRTNLNLAYNSIVGAINELITRHSLVSKQVKIGIGVAGYSVKERRDKLFELLNHNYPQIILNSDCHIACIAAHSGKDGSIIICGTGIVGYYIKDNTTCQIGGWGFPHGDLGSAAWIGVEICKLTCKAIDGVIKWSPLLIEIFNQHGKSTSTFKTWLINATPSDFATMANLIPQFNTIDPIACQILDNALNEIIMFTKAVINKTPKLPIKITGGLAPIYLPAIKERFSQVEISETSSAYGACLL